MTWPGGCQSGGMLPLSLLSKLYVRTSAATATSFGFNEGPKCSVEPNEACFARPPKTSLPQM